MSAALDPITLEVVSARIREAAATMEHVLYHSGYSPILRESKDGTAGITDPDGRVVIVGGGLQYHSLPYERAVASVLARYPRESLRPGESFIANDPYLAGNPHVPDVVAVTPCFADDRLIGFGVSIAHKSDVGGLVPGSSGAAAREIYHDGLLLPPVRYATDTGFSEIVEAIVRRNSRTPDVVLGDLRGQVGSTRIGAERLANLCREYGTETVTGVMQAILSQTGRRLRAELARLPDGEAESEGYLDHDGVVLDRPVRIHVRAVKRGDRLTLDFRGSAPQTQGPVNAIACTIEACALLATLATLDPTIPVNSGLRDAVGFEFAEASVVNPAPPATVNGYAATCMVAYGCVLAALGKLEGVQAVAPGGLGASAVAIGYEATATRKRSVQYELLITALGATERGDGAQIISPMTNMTPGTPVEVLESEYPIRVRRYDVRLDSGGAGRHRGGVGYVREYEVLADCVLTVRGTNRDRVAPGLHGGCSANPARTTLNPGRAAQRDLAILETNQLVAGDVVRFEKPGGSGLGSPLEREVEQVLDDVRNGYVSIAEAATLYGVTIDDTAGMVARVSAERGGRRFPSAARR